MAYGIGRARRRTLLLALSASLASFEGAASAQGTVSYYFAHIASAGVWRTTFTYVNQTTLPVTCNTSFYSDAGSPLPLSFNGVTLSSTGDTVPAGGIARRQTDAQTSHSVVTGWAVTNCTGPVRASALFRSYSGNVGLAPARFTAAVRLVLGTVVQPECNNFAVSLQGNTGIFGQTLAPNGSGITSGMLGYMFWGAEAQAPATCEGGVGTGANNYNIPIPMPPLRLE